MAPRAASSRRAAPRGRVYKEESSDEESEEDDFEDDGDDSDFEERRASWEWGTDDANELHVRRAHCTYGGNGVVRLSVITPSKIHQSLSIVEPGGGGERGTPRRKRKRRSRRPGNGNDPPPVVVSLISLAIGLDRRAHPPPLIRRRLPYHARLPPARHVEPSRLLPPTPPPRPPHNPDTSAFSWPSPRAP